MRILKQTRHPHLLIVQPRTLLVPLLLLLIPRSGTIMISVGTNSQSCKKE
jgi:hypothetical protein